MWRLERKTASLGRSAVPDTRLRTRACRRMRPDRLALAWSMSKRVLSLLLGGLAGLAADLLARVADALALVRVGPAQAADLGGDLADLLLFDPLDGQPGRRAHLELDAL